MIFQPPQISDIFTPLRQRDTIDALQDASNVSAGGGIETMATGRGRGMIARRPPTVYPVVWVIVVDEVSGVGAGPGKYLGKILDEPDVLPTAKGVLKNEDFGHEPDGDNDTLIINGAENWKDGTETVKYDLTHDPINATCFPGEYMGINKDGQYVVRIFAFDPKDCG